MSIAWKFFDVSEEDPCYAICGLCNKLIRRADSYSTSSLLKHLNSKHEREISEAGKSSSNKAVSDISSPAQKQRKLTAMNQASIDKSYRPVKQWKTNDQKAVKVHKEL